MKWIKIRFVVKPEGQYAHAWCGFSSIRVLEAVIKADVFCSGYMAGCGLSAMIDEVRDIDRDQCASFVIPEQQDRLALYLAKWKTG